MSAVRAVVSHAISETIKKFETIDILVNNAGITSDAIFHKMSLEQWQRVIDVNLTGTFLMTSAAVTYMREKKWGRIINISSTSAYGNVGQAQLCRDESRAAWLNKDLGKRAGALQYYSKRNRTWRNRNRYAYRCSQSIKEGWLKSMPLTRMGRSEDIANSVCFFASDEASFITGVELPVCGGFMIN